MDDVISFSDGLKPPTGCVKESFFCQKSEGGNS